ncbi:uncharacterized protein LOC119573835 [Penaeus monodon]|uniref:uncharacterized protein LOC119573835 n=1 Tax=Penaeus monodon TaxID=6687 RepID=UPI0018A7505E|nr:uncharacterized protein LOC119573835 [Penaeus monodon]
MLRDLARPLTSSVLLASLALALSTSIDPLVKIRFMDAVIGVKDSSGSQQLRRLPYCLKSAALRNASCPCDTALCQHHLSFIGEGVSTFCLPANITGLCYRSELDPDKSCGCCVVQRQYLCE